MNDILNCSNNFECSGYIALAVAPEIIFALVTTGLSIFVMKKLGKEFTLVYKILKITFRIEEALLLFATLMALLLVI